ncbi:MAG: ATP-binding cassette domain-containing protein [Pseudomonadota bacterium]
MNKETAPKFLCVDELRLSYPGTDGLVVDVQHIEAGAGSRIAVTGPSGSGKTSLIYLLTGIENADGGHIMWDGVDISMLDQVKRDRWRRQNVGFIFQDFNLVSGMSVIQNVLISCFFSQLRPTAKDKARAHRLLDSVCISSREGDVARLSRGEMQRVAIARALMQAPKIIIADEPTASLDAVTASKIIDLLINSSIAAGTTLLAVSHDKELVDAMEACWTMEAGRLLSIDNHGNSNFGTSPTG